MLVSAPWTKQLKSLYNHPYITAFLELHYSAAKKTRSSMRYSILPHAVIMLLLLQLASSFKGHLNQHYRNLLTLSSVAGFVVILMDVMCQKRVLAYLFPTEFKHKGPTHQRLDWKLFVLAVHLIGYLISIGLLLFSAMDRYLVPEKGHLRGLVEMAANQYFLLGAMMVYPTLIGRVYFWPPYNFKHSMKTSKTCFSTVSFTFASTAQKAAPRASGKHLSLHWIQGTIC